MEWVEGSWVALFHSLFSVSDLGVDRHGRRSQIGWMVGVLGGGAYFLPTEVY
jgi:hypothetical protein